MKVFAANFYYFLVQVTFFVYLDCIYPLLDIAMRFWFCPCNVHEYSCPTINKRFPKLSEIIFFKINLALHINVKKLMDYILIFRYSTLHGSGAST